MGVALECLVLRFGVLVRDPLAPAHRNQSLEDGVVSGPGAVQKLAGGVVTLLGEREQQVLGGDEFVLEAPRLIEGPLQHLVEGLPQVHPGLHAGGLRQIAGQPPRLAQDRIRVGRALFQYGPDNPFPLLHQGDEQVQRVDHLAFALLGNRLGLLHRLLGLLSKSIQTEHF